MLVPDLPSWAVVSPERRAHIARVVALVDEWAAAMNVGESEARRWRRAAVLHDALRDAPVEALRADAAATGLPEALWHGPAAAARAAREGETDKGILDAVRWHTAGHARWDDCGRMLYLADYLEPARRHDEDRAALAARVPRQPRAVLKEVAARRIGWLVKHGKQVAKETWEFWNGLAGDDSSS